MGKDPGVDLEKFWAGILKIHWGIDADLSVLPGELDLNFLAQEKNGTKRILKIMRNDCPDWLIKAQIEAIEHLNNKDPSLKVPKVLRSSNGASFIRGEDCSGNERLIWVQTYISGKCYAEIKQKSTSISFGVGAALGNIAKALADYKNKRLVRDFKWNLPGSLWIKKYFSVMENAARLEIISKIVDDFEEILPKLSSLEQQTIHNDPNDYNILVSGEKYQSLNVSGIIDFGDICVAPRVCDLSIAAAYIVLDNSEPEKMLAAFVSGYHSVYPLSTEEIDLVWRLLRMRLAVSVVNSTLLASKNSEDAYITISQAPAWNFLENLNINEGLIKARVRNSCGMPVVEGADRVMDWINNESNKFYPLFGTNLANLEIKSLSVENTSVPQNPFELKSDEAKNIGFEISYQANFWLGYYNEPRLIYTAPAFRLGPWKASNRRTVHIAIDVFADEGTELFAPLEGEVFTAEYRDNQLDYGGVIILKHTTPNRDEFFTLYGHLDPIFLSKLKVGDKIEEGQSFCQLGASNVNGGWAPHVHFQLALTTDGMEADWPGVADPDDLGFWNSICPNPASLLNLKENDCLYKPSNKKEVLNDRLNHFGGNLSISYDDPILISRAWKHHIFDEWGRPYLDAYNNVPHVGHSHPRINQVALDQLSRVNSNTRYLHPSQTKFAKKILSKLPSRFEVCYFVNSGSEANELALRLAQAHTGKKGIITPDEGYFGNTTGALSISAYKFKKPNGVGQADWVEIIEVPDDYRGSFKKDDPDRAVKFANLVDGAIKRLNLKGVGLSGFIMETFPSVGGQIIPPKRYLEQVYSKIRKHGGVCIADEVQTGLGRLGDYYFGFEFQEVNPDIVVLGKPLGNGHPLGAVITTREIGESFDNGIEFFSTFGGSNLSCRIGAEVLDIVDEEKLQKNAKTVGDFLISGFKELKNDFDFIGDVRGMGLFIGIEIIKGDGSEATELCAYIKNKMRENRILIGSDGPKDNIIKIRPPLTIEIEDAQMLLTNLSEVLEQTLDWT
ncbi:aminotransferase class III-fold pyridoxal phosphate-dependent enzyme [Rhodobacteraceae bacterium]|nr:aminotransferase class III-fold pyridoxal phosphate-dependent enzyme [Paracoccaceae bacterium]